MYGALGLYYITSILLELLDWTSRTQCSSPKSQIFLQLNFGQADWEAIQAEVAQYVNSDVRGVPFSMQVARPLSGFVEYTGTTVISPDPNLRVTEVRHFIITRTTS